MIDLSGKVAVVTGSSRGFGAKMVELIFEFGGIPVITYHSEDEVEKRNAIKLSESLNGLMVHSLDVTCRKSIATLFETVNKRYSRIDILINNAGINIVGDFDQITDEQWDAVLDVDLKGVFSCSQEVLPYMPENGRIINIGSVSGEYGGPRTPSYACAKAGVMALTHCLARFVGKKGITVNCVSPGPIESPMLSEMPQNLAKDVSDMLLLNRLGKPTDVAALCCFLCSEQAGFITGQTIGVNGGVWV
jgi:3-oxoacyl-[acyl-carrier protein] reductase